MQTTLALAALVAVASSQAVTSLITPDSSEPAGFSESYSGSFEITAVAAATEKRDLSKRTCGAAGSLTLTLEDGILKDASDRTGYIASNYQFQFDGPPQAGAIYTGGFSIGSNGSLALGGSAVFYECLSGSFYNLYDRSWAPQCTPILIVALPCGTTATTTSVSSATATDGTVTPVTQISDGQPQAVSAIPISEITDGQPQVPTSLVSYIATETSAVSTSIAVSASSVVASSSAAGATSSAVVSSKTSSSASSSITSKASVTTSVSSASAAAASSTTSALAAGASSVVVGSSFAAAVVGFAAMLLL